MPQKYTFPTKKANKKYTFPKFICKKDNFSPKILIFIKEYVNFRRFRKLFICLCSGIKQIFKKLLETYKV